MFDLLHISLNNVDGGDEEGGKTKADDAPAITATNSP
jgi:hypothetical protein